MGRKFLTYGAGLILVYLLVAYGTNSGKLISNSATGASTLVKSFQGR